DRARSNPDLASLQSDVMHGPALLADTETPNEIGVAIGILALEIVEQSPALADELQQTSAGMMILRVDLEVFGQVIDALTQERDLYLRRSGVAVMSFVCADDPGLAIPR